MAAGKFVKAAAPLLRILGGNRILYRNVGTMVNPNLESYKILAPADMFEVMPILMCRKAGSPSPYHPHAFEYEAIERVRPIDLMLKETDPATCPGARHFLGQHRGPNAVIQCRVDGR